MKKTEYETEIEKYNAKNPLQRLIIRLFVKDIQKLIKTAEPKHMLDVGCGIGSTISQIKKKYKTIQVDGSDILENSLKLAKKNNPSSKFYKISIFGMPFKKDSYDLAMCNSVLEHLENPNKAIEELKRISKKYVIISVPYEPFFSLINLLRLRYIKTLGNYPDHIQRWNKHTFKKLLKKYFKDVTITNSTFRIIALCKK